MNRSIAPPSYPIGKIDYPAHHQFIASGGVPVYLVHDEHCAVLKLELVFNGGARFQDQPFQAQSTASMIPEGTTRFTASQIAEKLDYYGSYLQKRAGDDDSSFVLYCLPKFLEPCLNMIQEVLLNAVVPDNELDIFKKNSIQRQKISESRNGYLTRRAFNELVYGKQSIYGQTVYQQDIENISRETVMAFYESQYKTGIKYLLVSGFVNDKVQQQLDQFCSGFKHSISKLNPILSQQSTERYRHIQNENAVQSTIRIGKLIPGRKHSDYRKLQVMSLILGGYFGSRLMSSIREEQGLTYGIHSAVESNLEAGAFYIETDMNNELAANGIEAIFAEIQKLIETPVEADELNTAKNYYLGSFLRSLDGPFSIADRAKIIIDFGFESNYYEEFLEIINRVSALDIQQLAQTYLDRKDLITVVTGKK
ncbi:MAG: pitrilysin family protein [Bacteroidia bacterium]|jgi:predicted Zn-dependent peptidase